MHNRFTLSYNQNGKTQKSMPFDYVISALPANILQSVMSKSHVLSISSSEISKTLATIPYVNMITMNFAFQIEQSEMDLLKSKSK